MSSTGECYKAVHAVNNQDSIEDVSPFNEPECQQMNLLRLSAVGQKWTRKKALAVFFSILHCLALQVLTERVFSCESELRGSSHRWRWCSHCSHCVAMAKQNSQITRKKNFKTTQWAFFLQKDVTERRRRLQWRISCGLNTL